MMFADAKNTVLGVFLASIISFSGLFGMSNQGIQRSVAAKKVAVVNITGHEGDEAWIDAHEQHAEKKLEQQQASQCTEPSVHDGKESKEPVVNPTQEIHCAKCLDHTCLQHGSCPQLATSRAAASVSANELKTPYKGLKLDLGPVAPRAKVDNDAKVAASAKASSSVANQPVSNVKISAPMQIRDHHIKSFLIKNGVDVEALATAWDDMVWREVLRPFNNDAAVKRARFVIECGQEILAEHERYHHLTASEKHTAEQRLRDAQLDIDALYKKYVWAWTGSSALRQFYERMGGECNKVWRAWHMPATDTSTSCGPLSMTLLLEDIGFYDYEDEGAQSVVECGASDGDDHVAIIGDKLPDFTRAQSDLLVKKVLMLALSYFEPRCLFQRWRLDDDAILSFPLMRVDVVKSEEGRFLGLTLTAHPVSRQDAENNGTAEEIEETQELVQECVENKPWGWGKTMLAAWLVALQTVSLQLVHQTYEGVTTLWTGRSLQERTALEVLELPNSVSKKEIKAKYHDLVLKHHPDKCSPETKVACQKAFEAIDGAYRTLNVKEQKD
jgi:hypothetical protein